MPFELNSGAIGLELSLSGRLSVQQAAQLWTTVQPAIAARDKIRLLAADLDEMDTSIVQILCLLGEQRPERPALLEITQVSDGFIRSLQRCGLEKFFVRASASPSRVEPAAKPDTPSNNLPVAVSALQVEAVQGIPLEATEAAISDPMATGSPESLPSEERSSSKSNLGSRVNA